MVNRIFALVGAISISSVVFATPEEDHADAIRALGSTNIVVKNPGYFFYGGEYVQPPYVVTREGDFLKINDRYIRFFCKWPQPKLRRWHVTYKMPEVPRSVDEGTSEFDPVVLKYWDDCFDYWLTTHAAEDKSLGASVIVAGMRKLPCVKDAFVDEHGDAQIVWITGQYTNSCDFSDIAYNPSCWDPLPVDVKAFIAGGDEAAVDLAESISNGRFLFWPSKDGGARLSGIGLESEVARILKNLGKCTSAEELSIACGRPWRVDLCEDILKHKDSYDDALRKRIFARVEEIEAAKRAERVRVASERRRAMEHDAAHNVEAQASTIDWTPEVARKGGMRFYAFYKDLHWSDDPPVPYEFWPRSTQPGDKWKRQLRENSVQAFDGYLSVSDDINQRVLEDIAAGCKPLNGGLRPETIQWSISCDFPVAEDDPVAYARIPMLVSANLNPSYLLREWDGAKNADKVIPLGIASGAEKSLFDETCAVIVFNDGTAEVIPAQELTYSRIYRRAFKGPQELGYLTVRGYVAPTGEGKAAE